MRATIDVFCCTRKRLPDRAPFEVLGGPLRDQILHHGQRVAEKTILGLHRLRRRVRMSFWIQCLSLSFNFDLGMHNWKEQ